MRTIRLIAETPVDHLAGVFLDHSSYDTLISGEDADVYKPDGSPLIKLRARCIAPELCRAAHEVLKELPLKYTGSNRGMAGGRQKVKEMNSLEGRPIVSKSGTRFRVMRQDGTMSNTIYAPPTPSAIAGYFERTTRYPYCRQTAFTGTDKAGWAIAVSYIRAVDAIFRETLPDRYAAQQAMVEKTHPDFVIKGTVFTTITVNRNWQTALHKDAGDLPEGFGVMSVLQQSRYEGGYLVFPQYRVAVDMRHGDVLLADVHSWHGNVPIIGLPDYERISVVFYYRRKMIQCGSAEEELARAKARLKGGPLFA